MDRPNRERGPLPDIRRTVRLDEAPDIFRVHVRFDGAMYVEVLGEDVVLGGESVSAERVDVPKIVDVGEIRELPDDGDTLKETVIKRGRREAGGRRMGGSRRDEGSTRREMSLEERRTKVGEMRERDRERKGTDVDIVLATIVERIKVGRLPELVRACLKLAHLEAR
jgi:hypothetical protein